MVKTMLLLSLPLAAALITGTPKPQPTPGPTTPPIPPQPVAADGVVPRAVVTNGKVDRAAFEKTATLWGPVSMTSRLGPTFADLNPNAEDTRPELYQQPSFPCENLSFANRTNPYQLGKDGCKPDNDYWSESGQVAYVPDDPANDPGLDRIQVYAYYNYVYALSPRLDYASGKPHPDPQTRDGHYRRMLGHYPQHIVGMVRSYSMLQNEALVVYREGLLGVAGTQTSRADNERPYPGVLFPRTKVPTGVAVTSSCEFALVPVMDTETLKAQLAVVALEGKYLAFHTWPYMALANQGCFSDMRLLGYVDLPIAAPSSVAAASSAWWGGPSQTGNKVLSQIDLADDKTRSGIYKGDPAHTMMVAEKGYAVVASKTENKVVIVDLSPLFKYVRESYLSSKESFESTMAQVKAKQFPATFSEMEAIRPKVVWEGTINAPNALLAGNKVSRWSPDYHKVHVASADGNIHIIDVSSVASQMKWEKKSPEIRVTGSFYVGKNPVAMVFNRFNGWGFSIYAKDKSGKQLPPEPQNNTFYVALRGDRKIAAAVTWGEKGEVYRVIEDKRMGDPVALNVATRGNILTVADYEGRKVLSFRMGRIVDRFGTIYGAGADGNAPFEFAGELPVAGKPFLVSSANVN